MQCKQVFPCLIFLQQHLGFYGLICRGLESNEHSLITSIIIGLFIVAGIFMNSLEVCQVLLSGWPANFDFHFPGISQVFPGDFSSFPRYFHGAAGSTRTHWLVMKNLKYKN